ncbi:peptide-methionine (S)-S-oxide reductase MsrA [Ascidiimonas aurantiaca]|uniref:peptide-methionine (S)-S-oxide reductase MsrA n=1 Tax=Ascidiimonas aurantiaca TaxID=1685432 RepID=UPI0030ED1937
MEISDTRSVAVFAGGCFWCTEAIFQRIKGVEHVVSGYTGGHIKNPAYREICTGRTGHAEGIQVTFNSSEVTYRELLEIFFATHDPTTLNRQGNDIGTQYRSAIFYVNDEQKKEATEYIALLESENVFENTVVTEISPLGVFYEAEEYHQDYYEQNKLQPYCQIIINPKLSGLRKKYEHKLKTV